MMSSSYPLEVRQSDTVVQQPHAPPVVAKMLPCFLEKDERNDTAQRILLASNVCQLTKDVGLFNKIPRISLE